MAYQLSQGVKEEFDFFITDPKTKESLHYFVRYPSAMDFEPSKALDTEADELREKMDDKETTLTQKKEYQTRLDEIEKEKAKAFFDLVRPDGHDVSIEDLINRVNVLVVKNFNNMIQKELGA